ncbi:unnamed protein product [Paramecium octaurelia]|uniref:Uncharacterized protein n=1 Tax=Paramecium octaurelia TaxID=43137 RepID=A0A8S1TBV3_PAROT|nr:unnamed protein product [Paramecium octaurelia]
MLRQEYKNSQVNKLILSYQSISHLMVRFCHLVVIIGLSVCGLLRQGNKMADQLVIVTMLIQSVSLLKVLDQHQVVQIILSINGILILEYKKLNQKAMIILFGRFDPLLMVLKYVSSSGDCTIRLRVVRIRNQIAQLNSYDNGILSVCFYSDGTSLASGSYGNSIRLWDVIPKQQTLQLVPHNHYVLTVDGSILAFSSQNKLVSLQYVNNGTRVLPQDKSYKDIQANFYHSIFSKAIPSNTTCIRTILKFSKKSNLEVQKILILNINYLKDRIYFNFSINKDIAFQEDKLNGTTKNFQISSYFKKI